MVEPIDFSVLRHRGFAGHLGYTGEKIPRKSPKKLGHSQVYLGGSPIDPGINEKCPSVGIEHKIAPPQVPMDQNSQGIGWEYLGKSRGQPPKFRVQVVGYTLRFGQKLTQVIDSMTGKKGTPLGFGGIDLDR